MKSQCVPEHTCPSRTMIWFIIVCAIYACFLAVAALHWGESCEISGFLHSGHLNTVWASNSRSKEKIMQNYGLHEIYTLGIVSCWMIPWCDWIGNFCWSEELTRQVRRSLSRKFPSSSPLWALPSLWPAFCLGVFCQLACSRQLVQTPAFVALDFNAVKLLQNQSGNSASKFVFPPLMKRFLPPLPLSLLWLENGRSRKRALLDSWGQCRSSCEKESVVSAKDRFMVHVSILTLGNPHFPLPWLWLDWQCQLRVQLLGLINYGWSGCPAGSRSHDIYNGCCKWMLQLQSSHTQQEKACRVNSK